MASLILRYHNSTNVSVPSRTCDGIWTKSVVLFQLDFLPCQKQLIRQFREEKGELKALLRVG